MNVKSLFVVGVFLLVVGAMFTAAHAQSIELEVEGQTLVGGDLAIAGQIFAGSPDLLTLTNPLGYIDGSKIASGTIGSVPIRLVAMFIYENRDDKCLCFFNGCFIR
jgi:hypothetical protein